MTDRGKSTARRRRTFSAQFPPTDDLSPRRLPRGKMGDLSPQPGSPGSKTSPGNGRHLQLSPRNNKSDKSRKDSGYSKVYKDAIHPEWPSDIGDTRSPSNSELVGFSSTPRQEPFDTSLTFPVPKRGSVSPDIGSHKTHMVTPDQVFGPMSPRRSSSYNDISRLSGNQTADINRRQPVSREYHVPRMGTSMDDITGQKSRLVRSQSRKSRTSHPETPLKSTSRFESVDSAYIDDRSRGSTGNIKDWESEKSGILNTTTVSIQKNEFSDPHYNSKLGRRFLSTLSHQSRGSSYYHGDIVDDNLMISPSKLDSTLIRLFSVPHDAKLGTKLEGQLMPFLNYSQSDLISLDPVTWRVRPMDPVHKETLNQEMEFLALNVNPREIIKSLYQEEAITHLDYNQLARTEGQGDKAVTRLLIRTLQRRGEKAYPALLKTLESHNYSDVCDRLANTEHILEEGMMEDRKEYQKKMQIENFKAVTTTFETQIKTPKSVLARSQSWTPYQPVYTVSPNQLASTVQVPVHVITPVPIPMPSQNPVMKSHRSSPADNLISGDPSSTNYHVIDSLKLEKHLTDLNTELKALHDDVTALKSSRSSSLSNMGRISKMDNRPTDQQHGLDSKINGQDNAKKSSSCSLL